MPRSALTNSWTSPVRVWVGVLLVVFLTEIGIMQSLPLLMPKNYSRGFESAIDSIVLTAVIGPVLWWTIVRPIREVLRIRTRYLSELFAEIEADRKQIAYEMHDGIGQPLSLLVSGLRSAIDEVERNGLEQRLKNLQSLAETALEEARRLSRGLRPSLLDDLGLGPALERIALEIRSNHPIDLILDVEEITDERVSGEIETAIFRIVQEALANVVRHSGATRAEVRVWKDRKDIRARVADNGAGIEPEFLSSQRIGHLGLTGMKERATILGGELTIRSRTGQGTRIDISLPAGEQTT
jgi:signal transduction histidine kinase